MSLFSTTKPIVAAAVGVLALAAAPASAVVVNFSAGGGSDTFELSPSAQDATVTFFSNSSFVDLTPGVAETVFLNGGEFDTLLLTGATANGSGEITQTLTITSGSATPPSDVLRQAVTVFTDGGGVFTPPSASLYIGAGPGDPFTDPTAIFDLGAAGILTVTPLGGSRVEQTSTPSPLSNSATFLLTAPIPEPASGLLIAAGGGAMLLARRRQPRA